MVAGYQLQNVGARYGGRADWALRDVSLTIEPGELIGIIGPNGSGKSTLLKLLAGLMAPQQGELRLERRPLADYAIGERARRIAVVPQSAHVVFPFTAREIIAMGRLPHRALRTADWSLAAAVGWPSETEADRTIVESVIEQLELGSIAERSVLELSGGERQKVFLARAFAQEPSILLLDEPTASLDLHHQAAIHRLVRAMHEERGVTVVMVSHDLNLAALFARRLVLLECGAVRRIGAPDDVLTQAELDRLYDRAVVVDRHPDAPAPRITLRP